MDTEIVERHCPPKQVEEKWKAIPDSDNCRISNHGNVKKGMNCLVDIQCDMEGYLRCTVGGKRGRDRIHRFVAEAFVKNDDPVNKTQVDHIDGNKQNNRADNLKWVSSRENTQAAADKGLLSVYEKRIAVIGVKVDEPDTVRLFHSQAEASEYIGASKDGCEVNKVISGKRYTTHGWMFRRLSEESISNIKKFAKAM